MKQISRKIRRRIGAGLLVLLALVVLASGGYYAWLITPPPMPKTVEEAGAMLVSPRYLRLPEARRFDYMHRAAELFDKASPEQKKKMMQNARKDKNNREAVRKAFEDRINMEMRNYVLADDFDRRVIIDRAIGMQEMMNAARSKKPAGEDTPERKARHERRKAEFIQQIQEHLEKGNPQHQAYFGEFVKAMITRREQMGLDPMPFDPDKR